MKAYRVVLAWWMALLVVVATACSSPAEGPTVEMRVGSWSPTSTTMEAGGGSFRITLVNRKAEPVRFAVLRMWAGDPNGLPILDGTIDLRQDQPFSDTQNPNYVNFDVVYPEYERTEPTPAPLVPDTIEPGEEKSVTIGGFKGGGEPGSYVVISMEPGGYEAGEYAVFAITG